MADQQPSPDSAGQTLNRLHEIARLLRSTHHLGPQTQQALAELADELGRALEQAQSSGLATAPLAESIGHVVESLHRAESEGPLEAARNRLLALTVSIEGQSPGAAAFTRRLADALANIGI